MVSREKWLEDFSNNSILLLYDAIWDALKKNQLVVQEDLASWPMWANELEKVMDRKKMQYKKIDFTRL